MKERKRMTIRVEVRSENEREKAYDHQSIGESRK
jgi:hypothetical protein